MVIANGNVIGAIKARSQDPMCASYAEIYLLGQIMRVGASVVLGKWDQLRGPCPHRFSCGLLAAPHLCYWLVSLPLSESPLVFLS